jgi:hypothetical protein
MHKNVEIYIDNNNRNNNISRSEDLNFNKNICNFNLELERMLTTSIATESVQEPTIGISAAEIMQSQTIENLTDALQDHELQPQSEQNFIPEPTSAEKKSNLKTFLPLTAQDCEDLRQSSGRSFINGVINEIFTKIAATSQTTFFNKHIALRYMAKTLKYEKRREEKVNFAGFSISKEKQRQQQEKLFRTIENNLTVSPANSIKKRLASQLPPDLAYQILANCQEITEQDGVVLFQMQNLKELPLTAHEKNTIFQIVKTVFRNFYARSIHDPLISDVQFIFTCVKGEGQEEEKQLEIACQKLLTQKYLDPDQKMLEFLTLYFLHSWRISNQKEHQQTAIESYQQILSDFAACSFTEINDRHLICEINDLVHCRILQEKYRTAIQNATNFINIKFDIVMALKKNVV